MRPDLVAEFLAATAVDEGVFRHPARFLRLRGLKVTGASVAE
ncbi:hypothetical protein [Streptomyces jeddahensis]|uniref:Uncharacterized protein n=1 Tax=Streptomyces jeddahensis TaxID=1716141 RepID=A0A177HJR4_9ACTN|nr:hypothetical protein [Streptomyces jeddahensis]OAH11165.1 hypothetical protein STSP_55420 [Streptomyces jeddahensis]